MTRPSAGLAVGVGGVVVGAATVGISIAALELSGHTDVWSNAWVWLGVSLAALGLAITTLFFLPSFFPRAAGQAPLRGAAPAVRDQAEDAEAAPDEDQAGQAAWDDPLAGIRAVFEEEDRQEEAANAPAFTGRWRHTSDGFAASPLSNMASTAMPGYRQEKQPFVRIGVCVSCDPIPPDASSSRMGARFLDFLSGDPVAGLITAMTRVDSDVAWTRLAGNGTLRLEAVLGSGDENAIPAASAMLLSPVTGMRNYGRADGIACLWLHIEPRGRDGTPQAAGLAE